MLLWESSPSTGCWCRVSHHLLLPVVAVGAITFYSLLLQGESSPPVTCCCCGSHHPLRPVIAVGAITPPPTACYCRGSHHLLQPVVAVGVITFYRFLLLCAYQRWPLWRSSSLIIILMIDDLSNLSAQYKQRGESQAYKYSGAGLPGSTSSPMHCTSTLM